MPDRNDYILESLRQAVPMIRNLARSCAEEYDELYQVAADVSLQSYDQAQDAANPRGYLQRTIRNAILTYTGVVARDNQSRLMESYLMESLDASLDDSGTSLLDLISEIPTQGRDDRNYDRLYALIDELPPVDRQALCMRYGLCGYSAHRPADIARILGIPVTTAQSRIYRAQKMLQAYTELLDLVQNQKPEP